MVECTMVLGTAMVKSSMVEVNANGREVEGLGGGREEGRLEG